MKSTRHAKAKGPVADRLGVDSSASLKKGLPRMVRNNVPILLVHADQASARSLADSLEQTGLSVFIARDGSHAMSILEFRAFGVLVIDIDPPVDERADLIGWSLRLCPRPRIVVVGSSIPREQEHAVLNRGAGLVLRKPVDIQLLLDFIRRARTRSSFTGTVEGVDILEYLQFVMLSGKTTIVEVTSTLGTDGRIFLMNGQVVHAECGVLRGVQALYRCLCFREGTFAHLPWCEPEQTTINVPGELLLLEAARKRDEVWGGSPGLD